MSQKVNKDQSINSHFQISLRDHHKSGGKTGGAKVVKKPNILAQTIKKPAAENTTTTTASTNQTNSEPKGAVLPPVSLNVFCAFFW